MTRDVFATRRNAVINASRRPVVDDEVREVLRMGAGAGHVVHAVFGDCAIDTLVEAAGRIGMSYADLLAAYRTARSRHVTANATLKMMPAEADFGFLPAQAQRPPQS